MQPLGCSSAKIFAKRIPIHLGPTLVQAFPFGRVFDEPCLVESEVRSGTSGRQIEPYHRIEASLPVRGTPCLHAPSIRRQLDIAAFHAPAEKLERSAWLALYFSRILGERGELLRVEQDLINARRSHLEVDFLVDGRERPFRLRSH